MCVWGVPEPSVPASLPPLHSSLALIKVLLIIILIWNQVSATDHEKEILPLLALLSPGKVTRRQEIDEARLRGLCRTPV